MSCYSMKRINLLQPFSMISVFQKMTEICRIYTKQVENIVSRSCTFHSKLETIDIPGKNDIYKRHNSCMKGPVSLDPLPASPYSVTSGNTWKMLKEFSGEKKGLIRTEEIFMQEQWFFLH